MTSAISNRTQIHVTNDSKKNEMEKNPPRMDCKTCRWLHFMVFEIQPICSTHERNHTQMSSLWYDIIIVRQFKCLFSRHVAFAHTYSLSLSLWNDTWSDVHVIYRKLLTASRITTKDLCIMYITSKSDKSRLLDYTAVRLVSVSLLICFSVSVYLTIFCIFERKILLV